MGLGDVDAKNIAVKIRDRLLPSRSSCSTGKRKALYKTDG